MYNTVFHSMINQAREEKIELSYQQFLVLFIVNLSLYTMLTIITCPNACIMKRPTTKILTKIEESIYKEQNKNSYELFLLYEYYLFEINHFCFTFILMSIQR